MYLATIISFSDRFKNTLKIHNNNNISTLIYTIFLNTYMKYFMILIAISTLKNTFEL